MSSLRQHVSHNALIRLPQAHSVLPPLAPSPAVVATHCPYCSLQCGITLDTSTRPIILDAQSEFPTNLGGLCAKGWTAAELIDHPERLTTPLVRDARDEPLRPSSWDEALDRSEERRVGKEWRSRWSPYH